MKPSSPDGRATQTASTFRMETSVGTTIRATPESIWRLLTGVEEYAKWNSTIVSITGDIAAGGTVRLISRLDPKRTFKLSISEFEPPTKLAWRDGFAPMFQGNRTYTLTPNGDGTTHFSMVEVFSGLMLPLIKGSLPDFRENFEQIANDLKRAAERR